MIFLMALVGYVPLSSANPLLDNLCKGKQRLILYNKSDLAEPRVNRVLYILGPTKLLCRGWNDMPKKGGPDRHNC